MGLFSAWRKKTEDQGSLNLTNEARAAIDHLIREKYQGSGHVVTCLDPTDSNADRVCVRVILANKGCHRVCRRICVSINPYVIITDEIDKKPFPWEETAALEAVYDI